MIRTGGFFVFFLGCLCRPPARSLDYDGKCSTPVITGVERWHCSHKTPTLRRRAQEPVVCVKPYGVCQVSLILYLFYHTVPSTGNESISLSLFLFSLSPSLCVFDLYTYFTTQYPVRVTSLFLSLSLSFFSFFPLLCVSLICIIIYHTVPSTGNESLSLSLSFSFFLSVRCVCLSPTFLSFHFFLSYSSSYFP